MSPDKEYLDAIQEDGNAKHTDQRISALEARVDDIQVATKRVTENTSAQALRRLSWAGVALAVAAFGALLYWIFKPKPSPVRVLVPLPDPPAPAPKPIGFVAHQTPKQ